MAYVTATYGRCESNCTSTGAWSLGLATSLGLTILEQEAQSIDWFAVTADGRPRMSFIAPLETFGDTMLWYFSCDIACTQSNAWTRSAVMEMDLASTSPAHLQLDENGQPRIFAPFLVIGDSRAELLYFECLDACDSDSARWAAPTEVFQYNDGFLEPHAISTTLLDGQAIVASYRTENELVDVSLWHCANDCTNPTAWMQNSVGERLPIPASVASLSATLDLITEDGLIHLGLIGKDRAVNSVNRVMQFSCAGVCTDNQWSVQTLADTSSIEFENQGICLFIGTAASEPLSLLSGAFSFEIVPQWGCSTTPVEVVDAEGNVFIDTNADIRFFEIAAFGTSR